MRKLIRNSLLELPIALVLLSPMPAQNAGSVATGANSTVATPSPAGQAPDEATNKITELVHAGKYAEAQQLAASLLIVYPGDQRLVKAKALIDRLLAPPSASEAAPANSQPTQTAASANAEQLTGMDKVDYNALIELARQAQQGADLAEQTKLLKQFMSQSSVFLQKHPNQTLLWQLRAQLAISLNEPMEGYEAGQRLLAAGAADSNDVNEQRLLAQLKNKGWLDKKDVATKEQEKQFAWLLGTWNVSWKWWWGDVNARDREQFVVTDSGIEGYVLGGDGVRNKEPDFKAKVLESGELKWESYLPPTDTGELYVFRQIRGGLIDKLLVGRRSDPDGYFGSTHHFDHGLLYQTNTGSQPFYPSGWQPVVSSAFDKYKRTLTIVVPAQQADSSSHSNFIKDNPVTLTFSKAGNAQEEQAQ